MALSQLTLETQLLNLFNEMSTRTEDQPQSNQDLARQLAAIIDAYIKMATVNVTVSTTGTAAAQTGVGTGSLS